MVSTLLPHPPTEMIYMSYEGNWQMECTSSVLQVIKNTDPLSRSSEDASGEELTNKPIHIVLDRSVLHAQGGGQPTDTGRIVSEDGSVEVTISKVTMDRSTGVALHTGIVVGLPRALLPNIGDTVRVVVDQDNRRILSECHTAGHVVDAALERCGKLWKPSKAYHFLDGPYVEYVGSIPVNERDQLLVQLQDMFRQLVREDIATKIEIVDKVQADQMCNRIGPNYVDVAMFADAAQQVRVVTVANFSCPCGGTHVRSTADLATNGWGITGIKSKKGVVRIKYGQNCVGNE